MGDYLIIFGRERNDGIHLSRDILGSARLLRLFSPSRVWLLVETFLASAPRYRGIWVLVNRD